MMYTFIKAQAALIAGSLADFLLTFFLVSILNCWYVPATIIGNIAGAAAFFVLSRKWVFTTTGKSMPVQAAKFVIMWVGNILLSAGGVYLLTHNLNMHYLLSKLVVSIVLGTTYTYFMSKWFVFE